MTEKKMQKENQRCDITPFEIIHIEKYIIRNLYINSVGLALIYNWLNIKKKKKRSCNNSSGRAKKKLYSINHIKYRIKSSRYITRDNNNIEMILIILSFLN